MPMPYVPVFGIHAQHSMPTRWSRSADRLAFGPARTAPTRRVIVSRLGNPTTLRTRHHASVPPTPPQGSGDRLLNLGDVDRDRQACALGGALSQLMSCQRTTLFQSGGEPVADSEVAGPSHTSPTRQLPSLGAG